MGDVYTIDPKHFISYKRGHPGKKKETKERQEYYASKNKARQNELWSRMEKLETLISIYRNESNYEVVKNLEFVLEDARKEWSDTLMKEKEYREILEKGKE